jgi:1-acyl-sn-glycerol-3-phosphate acyltransferase
MTRPVTPPPISISPRWQSLALRYARGYLSRHFHALRLMNEGAPPVRPPAGCPLIVALNHPSWWDPIVGAVLAAACLPNHRPVAPIDAEALEHYPILKRLGLFPVSSGPKGARDFLTTGTRILADPTLALWVTVEGRFTDPRERPVRIRPGVGHLATRVAGTTVLPLALEYVFWNERTPEALARFGHPIRLDSASPAEWTQRVESGLESAMNTLARAAIARDPSAFETLVGGRAGVGGVYDLWRRARAALAGRPFQAEHDKDPSVWPR